MKRLAFGCFGVMSILAAVGAFWAYVHIVEPTREYLAALPRVAAIGDLDKGIGKKGPFVPPASGELTPAMAERFAQVQRSVRDALGNRYDELSRRAGELQKAVASGRTAPIAAVMDVYKEVVGAVEDGKRAQVEALNRAGFSLDEYRVGAAPDVRGGGAARDERGRRVDPAGAHEPQRRGGRDVRAAWRRPAREPHRRAALRRAAQGVAAARVVRALTGTDACPFTGTDACPFTGTDAVRSGG